MKSSEWTPKKKRIDILEVETLQSFLSSLWYIDGRFYSLASKENKIIEEDTYDKD